MESVALGCGVLGFVLNLSRERILDSTKIQQLPLLYLKEAESPPPYPLPSPLLPPVSYLLYVQCAVVVPSCSDHDEKQKKYKKYKMMLQKIKDPCVCEGERFKSIIRPFFIRNINQQV